MRRIKVWEAEDGKMFRNADDCLKHEDYLMKFNEIQSKYRVEFLEFIQDEEPADGVLLSCRLVPVEALFFVDEESAREFVEQYNTKPRQPYYAEYIGREMI